MVNVGHTPLIRLKNIENKYHLPFELYAKLEANNPTGSIKDRPALSIIENALKNKEINSSSTIVEATSGNMGISFAYLAREFNMKCVIFMPETASIERRIKMEEYGASIILVKGGMSKAVEEALSYVKEHDNCYYTDQFVNPYNMLAHYEHTSEEIIKDLGRVPDYFVAGMGTSGTVMGNSKKFKEIDPNIKVIGIEPEESPLITKGEAHPHLIQGIGANFIPKLFNPSLVDEVITVSNSEAYEGTRELKKEEGLFVGITSGCALKGAIKLKDKIKENSKVVIILPDSGDRYLSVENLYE